MAQLGAGFKPNLPPLKDAKVLVVGASGQVGELVRTLLQAQLTHDHASAVLPLCCAPFAGVERRDTCHLVFRVDRPRRACIRCA